MIDPDKSLGELAAERPARAELFERLRFDYCCGGGQTLAHACQQRGLDPETVCRMLEALESLQPGGRLLDTRHGEPDDWRSSSIAELCEHIVTAHHDRLRVELPRIDELLGTVVRVHGTRHHELADLLRLFRSLRQELESHIQTEEQVVFPACRAAERGRAQVPEEVLAAHEQEHQQTGDVLAALRELAHDYDPASALCATHRRLLDALERFERDLHQHIHEENNVLFVRARAMR